MLQPPSSSELVTVEVVSAGTLDTSDKTEDTAYPYSMTEPFLGERTKEPAGFRQLEVLSRVLWPSYWIENYVSLAAHCNHLQTTLGCVTR